MTQEVGSQARAISIPESSGVFVRGWSPGSQKRLSRTLKFDEIKIAPQEIIISIVLVT